MNARELRELKRRARALGVQTEFVDSSGHRREASAETLRTMIELCGETRSADHEPTVIVAWNGVFKMPANSSRVIIECEDGSELSSRGGSRNLQLPFGYHTLRISSRDSVLLISAPTKAHAPRNKRASGVFAPMYAVRSEKTWGAGTLTDWESLCARVADTGSSVAGTLPLLGAFLDEWKCEPSPYSPATRLFWNEFYLDVTRVPEFAASKSAQRLLNSSDFQGEIAQLRKSNLVDYKRGMALKRRVIEQLASGFFRKSSGRRDAFETFLKSRPECKRYAAFRAACERRQQAWHLWPGRLRNGQLLPADYNERAQRYHLFAQWLAQEQMDAVLASCRERGVKFYLDLPLGVNPDGYDVWANQQLFVSGASVGAPPDPFFTKGQNWGFPPLHPQRIRENGYRYVIDYLRFQMRHTGLLRLDHVMGLHRLWWVPPGATAADGAYVNYNAEELYAILSLESHRHQTVLVGENLGTVPPEVNRSMKRHGLRTMYVAQYEMQPNAKEPLPDPPRDCVASINTHDMPMWAAHWKGLDIADRQQLGLLSTKEAREEKKRRAKLRQVLAKYLRRKKLLTGKPNAHNVLSALLKFLARSEAELVLVNLEDLWLETEPQNTPGTSTQRVNWRRKMKVPLERAPGILPGLRVLFERNGP